MRKLCINTGILAVSLGLAATAVWGDNSSFNYKDLFLKDNYDPVPAKMLAPAQIKQDLALLEYSLLNGYVVGRYIDQDIFKKVLNNLKILAKDATGFCSARSFCDKIADITFDIPDQHLRVVLDSSCGSRMLKQLDEKGNVGENAAANEKKHWKLTWRNVGKHKVPVICITSCERHFEGFVDTVERLRKTAPAIIIDLRGNWGGNDNMTFKMANILYGQRAPLAIKSIVWFQTPEALALQLNATRMQIDHFDKTNQKIPKFIAKSHKETSEKLKRAAAGKLPPERVHEFDKGEKLDPGKFYKKPIYLLVDRECGSACEITTLYFEKHPYAKTAGENTNGNIHSNNAAVLVLPNSKVRIFHGNVFRHLNNGMILERVGLAPQIRIPSGSDALEAVLKRLKSELPEY